MKKEERMISDRLYLSVSCLWQLTIQLALMGFAEFVLHLTRMNPDMIYLHQDCGYVNISYFKFDIDDQSGTWRQTTAA